MKASNVISRVIVNRFLKKVKKILCKDESREVFTYNQIKLNMHSTVYISNYRKYMCVLINIRNLFIILENIKTINFIYLFLISSIFVEQAEGGILSSNIAYKHNERNKIKILLRSRPRYAIIYLYRQVVLYN